MAYRLAPQDYQMMLEQFGGDTEAAHAMLKQRGYMLPGEEDTQVGASDFSVMGTGAEEETNVPLIGSRP